MNSKNFMCETVEAQKQALLGRIMQRDQVNHVEGKNKCIMSIHT